MATSAELDRQRVPAPPVVRRGRPRLRYALGGLSAVVALLTTQLGGAGVAGASPSMQATGSSFASVAIQQWVGQASTLYGLAINWQVSSSVVGLNNFAQNQEDFSASDIPYSSQQASFSPSVPYQYLPDVAGGLSFMYNLSGNDGQQITSLVLNSRVAEMIFLGEITSWNDPHIAQLNPQLQGDLPNQKIIPVYRSDASGENYLLSDYFLHQDGGNGGNFAATQGVFQSGLQGNPTAIWPIPAGGVNPPPNQYPAWAANNLVGENGSDNAANYVSALSSNGAITYVETAYAKEHNMPVASLTNASGNAVQPTSVNVATALEAAILHPDLTQDLSGVYTNQLQNAYPLSAYSYFVTPCSPSLAQAQGASCADDPGGAPSNFPSSKGQALGIFENFIACAGQQKMDTLGYSPLPPNLVNEDFAAIGRLNGATQPAAVPNGVDPNSPCRNPYVDGQIPLPGEPTIQGQSGGGVNLTTTSAAANAGGAAAGGSGGVASGPGSHGSAAAGHGGAGSGSGSTGAGAGGSYSTKGLSAKQIAEGYRRLANGQIVKIATPADRFKNASGLQDALYSVEGAGVGYLGWAILILAIVALPPFIASRRKRALARPAPGEDGS